MTALTTAYHTISLLSVYVWETQNSHLVWSTQYKIYPPVHDQKITYNLLLFYAKHDGFYKLVE